MSISTMHLVSPKLPTVLGHQATVDLPGYDLWLHYVDNVHVLHGQIDLERFKNALSDTLQLYPHAAGQLRCQDGRWFIELTNNYVPVDVSYIEGKASSSVLQDDWVIQEDLSSLVNQQPDDVNPVNGTVPLLRFKLTFFTEETCIGVTWHHVLADAIAHYRFTHTLSQFYQNKLSEFATPTFRKHFFPPPSEAIVAEYYPKMRLLHDAYPFAEISAKFTEASKGVENLQWRFTGEELHRLHAITNPIRQQKFTIQDCLTAYIVTALNRCQEKPIRTVSNVGSIVTEQVPLDMVGIATAIRTSINRSRGIQELENYLTTASDHILTTTNSGKSFFFTPCDDVMTVNSNFSVDWCSAHFGFPDGSKFHTSGVTKFYFRPFKSNPVKGVDGIWHSRQGSIDISMGVPTELKSRILDVLSRGFEQD
ncbi:hypothetical protein J3A83DRAFT_4401226 [Scleroderma citrinum]